MKLYLLAICVIFTTRVQARPQLFQSLVPQGEEGLGKNDFQTEDQIPFFDSENQITRRNDNIPLETVIVRKGYNFDPPIQPASLLYSLPSAAQREDSLSVEPSALVPIIQDKNSNVNLKPSMSLNGVPLPEMGNGQILANNNNIDNSNQLNAGIPLPFSSNLASTADQVTNSIGVQIPSFFPNEISSANSLQQNIHHSPAPIGVPLLSSTKSERTDPIVRNELSEQATADFNAIMAVLNEMLKGTEASGFGVPIPTRSSDVSPGNINSITLSSQNNGVSNGQRIGVPLPSNNIESRRVDNSNLGLNLPSQVLSLHTNTNLRGNIDSNTVNSLGVPLPMQNSQQQVPFSTKGIFGNVNAPRDDTIPGIISNKNQLSNVGIPLPVQSLRTAFDQLNPSLSSVSPSNSRNIGVSLPVKSSPANINQINPTSSLVPISSGSIGVPLPVKSSRVETNLINVNRLQTQPFVSVPIQQSISPNSINGNLPFNSILRGVSLPVSSISNLHRLQQPSNGISLGVPLPELGNSELLNRQRIDSISSNRNALANILSSRFGNGQNLFDNSDTTLPQINRQDNANLHSSLNIGIPLPEHSGFNLRNQHEFRNNVPLGVSLPRISGTSLGSFQQTPNSASIGTPVPQLSSGFRSGIQTQSRDSTIGVSIPQLSSSNLGNAEQQLTGNNFIGASIPGLPSLASGNQQQPTGRSHPIGVSIPKLSPSNLGSVQQLTGSNVIGVSIPELSSLSSGNQQPSTGSHSFGMPIPELISSSLGQQNQLIGSNIGVSIPELSSLTTRIQQQSKGSNVNGINIPEISSSISGNVQQSLVSDNIGSPSPELSINTEERQQSTADDFIGVSIPEIDGSNLRIQQLLTGGSSVGIQIPMNPSVGNGGQGSLSQFQDLTVGELLLGINGRNGIMVLPMSALDKLNPGDNSQSNTIGIPLPENIFNGGKEDSNAVSTVEQAIILPGDDLDSNVDDSTTPVATTISLRDSEVDIAVDFAETTLSTTTAVPTTTTQQTTTRRRRPTRKTTTTPPPVIRDYLSDVLYSKGQWFGTVVGALVDYGKIFSEVFQEQFATKGRYR